MTLKKLKVIISAIIAHVVIDPIHKLRIAILDALRVAKSEEEAALALIEKLKTKLGK